MPTYFADEKFVAIHEALQRRGFKRIDSNQLDEEKHCDILWVNLKSIRFNDITAPSFQLINHFQGAQHYSNKAYISFHLAASRFPTRYFPLTWSPSYQGIHELVVTVLKGSVDFLTSYLSEFQSIVSLASESRVFETINRELSDCSHYHQLLKRVDAAYLKSSDFKLVEDSLCFLKHKFSQIQEGLKDKTPCEEISNKGHIADNLWLIKPVGGSCGEGVRVLRGIRAALTATLTSLQQLQTKCVLQQYIRRPLLLRNRQKFDIRQWVLITSLQPLVIYGFDECYVRLSLKSFDDERESTDALVHLTNHAVQKQLLDDSQPAHHSSDDDSDDDDIYCESMMTQKQLDAALCEFLQSAEMSSREIYAESARMNPFREIILPQMKDLVVRAIESANEILVPPNPSLGEKRLSIFQSATKSHKQNEDTCAERDEHTALRPRERAIEWLGFDLIIDCAPSDSAAPLQVKLLEVNTSPDISYSTRITKRLVRLATDDLFRLALDEEERVPRADDVQEISSELRRSRWRCWHINSTQTNFLATRRLKREFAPFRLDCQIRDFELVAAINENLQTTEESDEI